jgi:hypothetical protein
MMAHPRWFRLGDTDFCRSHFPLLTNRLEIFVEGNLVSKHVEIYASHLECMSNLPILAIDTKKSSALGNRQVILNDF